MKIWLDDIRPAPDGYIWCKSVRQAKRVILEAGSDPEIIDCDHDLGDYAIDGGDGIELLNWLEATNRSYPIRLHTMNPVGRERMRAVIQKNEWEELF